MNAEINLTEQDRMCLIKLMINKKIVEWARKNHADQVKQITDETLKQLGET